MSNKKNILQVHPKDNVLVALHDLPKGSVVNFNGVAYTLQDDILAKHKFFMHDMQPGDEIIMYGVLVGKAQLALKAGNLMSTSNTKHAADPFVFKPYHYQWLAPDVSKYKNRTFNGYHRSDGRVGTANYWLFMPTVFCENRNLDVIKEALHTQLGYAVTDRYKQKTKLLLELYKNGGDIANADLSIKEADIRIGLSIDGPEFLHNANRLTRSGKGTFNEVIKGGC